MKLKKVATITQEEAVKIKELDEEARELNYALVKYSIKQRRFLWGVLSKHIGQAEDPKPYIVKGRGIYTNG